MKKITFLILVFVLAIAHYFQLKPEKKLETHSAKLIPTQCWFDVVINPYRAECFYVDVAEKHNSDSTRRVQFPLVKLSNPNITSSLAPILHLGAGGPGAAMYFDENYVVEYLIEQHDAFSLAQGRDLYFIDPRGSGLAKPLLSCDNLTNKLAYRLSKNLQYHEEWQLSDADYRQCIKHFADQGVQFSEYNSFSISEDVEHLRLALGVESWVLIGVSYGAVYAQLIAKRFPETVEALILDSPAFPNIKIDNNFLERTLKPYDKLFAYCETSANCDRPADITATRFWKLYEKLNKHPLLVELKHPYKEEKLTLQLNGERFLFTVFEAIYGNDIFNQLEQIFVELEHGEVTTFTPHIENYIAFLLDTSFGDISTTAHYCYDDKAYINLVNMRAEADKIPYPPLREMTISSIEWPDHCERMEITNSNQLVASALVTDIPTLFLQGSLDSITPIEDINSLRGNFSNSLLLTFEHSHSVLSGDNCAEFFVSDFLNGNAIKPSIKKASPEACLNRGK